MKDKTFQSTPIKVAVLVDGGFFIKRYNALYNKGRRKTAQEIAKDLYTICLGHVGTNNYLYRIFYYDCKPFEKKEHNPVSKRCIDFSRSPEAVFRRELFACLKKMRKVALRIGEIREKDGWMIHPSVVSDLLSGKRSLSDMKESDVYFSLQQKGIDMKIGVDIASMSLKRFVDKIVLVSGDSDFVPAAKLARREGIDFVLDAMHSSHIEESLFEHIDGLESIRLYNRTSNTSKRQGPTEHGGSSRSQALNRPSEK